MPWYVLKNISRNLKNLFLVSKFMNKCSRFQKMIFPCTTFMFQQPVFFNFFFYFSLEGQSYMKKVKRPNPTFSKNGSGFINIQNWLTNIFLFFDWLKPINISSQLMLPQFCQLRKLFFRVVIPSNQWIETNPQMCHINQLKPPPSNRGPKPSRA